MVAYGAEPEPTWSVTCAAAARAWTPASILESIPNRATIPGRGFAIGGGVGEGVGQPIRGPGEDGVVEGAHVGLHRRRSRSGGEPERDEHGRPAGLDSEDEARATARADAGRRLEGSTARRAGG